MRKLHLTAAVAALSLAACGEAPTSARSLEANGPSLAAGANVNGNKLSCFTGGGGTCDVSKSGTVELVVPSGGWAGVYLSNPNLDGKALADVNKLAFSYAGTVGAGAPRISLPIDSDGDGDHDGYAFIAAYYCNDGAGNVDALNDATCGIWYGADPMYEDWAAFVAAYPDARVTEGYAPFIIADEPGSYTLSDIQLGKGSARGTN